MYNIQTLNKISSIGTDVFDKAKYTVSDTPENPDAIMVRSAKMHDMEFGSNLLAIARAGAGVNNIPIEPAALKKVSAYSILRELTQTLLRSLLSAHSSSLPEKSQKLLLGLLHLKELPTLLRL